MKIIVNMHEAKSQLSRLVERARLGEEVLIAKDGIVVAKIVVATPTSEQRPRGTYAGQIEIGPDFDAPLPDEFTGTDH
jgi:antitoxin (DNA-binding transcriptional repressor) of toxin-antitoxin stability system